MRKSGGKPPHSKARSSGGSGGTGGAGAGGGLADGGGRRAAGDAFDFGEDESGFGFERLLHLLEVGFGVLAGAVLEFEVTEVLVEGVASLEELVELGAVRGGVGGVGVDEENEDERGGGERDAGEENGAVEAGEGLEGG